MLPTIQPVAALGASIAGGKRPRDRWRVRSEFFLSVIKRKIDGLQIWGTSGPG
ncbi:hypothetical protein KSP40_PGU006563 [Platanthera guangdongensis]|uniref:Uncharacterized protein n=1 Tax=Platanthera guangdongensis TaxID=2320717 RepID=A0ABR2LE01_9ASPA